MTVTCTEVAPATTWWLVTTSPSEGSTMPVPAAAPPEYFIAVWIRTRPVSWSPTACEVVSLEVVPDEVPSGAVGRDCWLAYGSKEPPPKE